MEMEQLIPNTKNDKWVIKKNTIYYHLIVLNPILTIINDTIYIFLDNKLPKPVIIITNHLKKLNKEFYFITPDAANPKEKVNHEKNIEHYLKTYSKEQFFHGFKSIEFDLITNMLQWSKKQKCTNLIKDILDDLIKDMEKIHFDWYNNTYVKNYSDEIIEEFKLMWRHIQINNILSK